MANTSVRYNLTPPFEIMIKLMNEKPLKKIRVLFVVSHRPGRSPNQRYRFEQYIPFLEDNNIECDLSYIVTEADDKNLYKKGKLLKKIFFIRRTINHRKNDLKKISNYDVIFICREALLTGSLFFEKAVKRSGKKIIYDFDDAIWLKNVSEVNRWFSFIKNPGKTSEIIKMADLVFAGNKYLATYASRFNPNVTIIPSTIDTEEYQPTKKIGNDFVTIGWSGSITTILHFKYVLPALLKLRARYGDKVKFKVIGDPAYRNSELGIKGLPWKRETEAEDLSDIDIGIMPLPDNKWTRGKCGLKGLQYMGMGIPAVLSSVGVNKEIITHGVNGFLAATTDEWVNYLSMLIEDRDLRIKLGAAARETVVKEYSVKAYREVYLEKIRSLVSIDESQDIPVSIKEGKFTNPL